MGEQQNTRNELKLSADELVSHVVAVTDIDENTAQQLLMDNDYEVDRTIGAAFEWKESTIGWAERMFAKCALRSNKKKIVDEAFRHR